MRYPVPSIVVVHHHYYRKMFVLVQSTASINGKPIYGRPSHVLRDLATHTTKSRMERVSEDALRNEGTQNVN